MKTLRWLVVGLGVVLLASSSLHGDPIAQQAYLKASNTGTQDQFGGPVAISGDTIVVGVRYEDSGTTGVNSVPNESAANSGAAYALVRSGTTWTQQAYLKAFNTEPGDEFGSVAISGDTIVVGAKYEDTAAVGVNNPPIGWTPDSGAAYVFVRNGTTWTQQAYLKASDSIAGAEFGTSVAISGNTIVVGVWKRGAVYVFVRSGSTWTEQSKLQLDPNGRSVAISGDTIAIGAPGSDAVYVFSRSGTTWTQQAYIIASNSGTGDGFGSSIGLSGDTLVAGASSEDSGTSGSEHNSRRECSGLWSRLHLRSQRHHVGSTGLSKGKQPRNGCGFWRFCFRFGKSRGRRVGRGRQ